MGIFPFPVAEGVERGRNRTWSTFQARRHIVTVVEEGLRPKSGFIELSPVHLIFDTCIVSIIVIFALEYVYLSYFICT